MPERFRIGADENGLGARLGPLVVTAVLARVDERGDRLLSRKLPKKLSVLLGDSKALVSHHDIAIGEAWTRALVEPRARTPEELFSLLSLEGAERLREPCPDHVQHQCWSVAGEQFVADDDLLARVLGAKEELTRRGVGVLAVRSSVLCTQQLNLAREQGKNRFVADLHAMERLVLALREIAGHEITAVCGKVGSMGDYSRFFGPLAGLLHVVLEQKRELSAYHFPRLGELRFAKDADAHDALVMLASLVGKYVRELLMARVARFYAAELPEAERSPSGYGDPVTARFVAATALVRHQRRVPETCFERARANDG